MLLGKVSSDCPPGKEKLSSSTSAHPEFLNRDGKSLFSFIPLKSFPFSSPSLQTILGLPSLEEVLQPAQIIPEFVMYNMNNTSKHGVVILQDKAGEVYSPGFASITINLFHSLWFTLFAQSTAQGL